MSSADVIDALFVKTVDMVQSLPKAGPIQTSYEEKLALYSLYKQATEGDVSSKRPGMLDMLGRAKWDAWAKVSGLPPRDAKQMYVESMLRILRRFSDRPQAVALIEELESFSGQVAQRVMDGSLAQVDSEDDSITDHDSDAQQRLDPTGLNDPHPAPQSRYLQAHPPSVAGASTAATRGGGPLPVSPGRTPMASDSDQETSEDDRLGAQPGPFRSIPRNPSNSGPVSSVQPPSRFQQRPGSISGGEAYSRTPASHSHAVSPPMQESSLGLRNRGPSSHHGAPSRSQPGFHSAAASVAGSGYPRQQEPAQYQRSTYAASSVGGRSIRTGGGPAPSFPPRPPSLSGAHPPRPEMELALQSIQASLAALHERMNRVETRYAAGGADEGRRSRSSQGSSSASKRLFNALINVVDDVRQLIGLGGSSRSPRSEALAPSFLAEGGGRGNAAVGLLGSPIKVLIALINLSARLALDLVSLILVSTFFLYAFKKITGKGDPLVMLRILRRMQETLLKRSPAARQLAKNISST